MSASATSYSATCKPAAISGQGLSPKVKLVPCAEAAGLKQLGALAAASPELLVSQVDAAFAEAVDQQVAELFNS